MKRMVILFQMLLVFHLLSAQITFEKKYGNPGIYQAWASCAQQTSDNGYIITGTITPYNSLSDLYLVRTNLNGDTLWTKQYGSDNAESGKFIEQTNDGGFIIAGTKSRYQTGMNEIWLVKTDVNGDTLWSKTFIPNFTNSEATATCVDQTSDGGYIIAGAGGLGAGGKNIFLVKTNANGDMLWTKRYFGEVNAVQQASDGGYVICGEYYKQPLGSGTDALLMKLNSSGDSLWAKTYDNFDYDHTYSLNQTSDGGFIITGSYWAGSYSNSDIFLIKTTDAGEILWQNTFGGSDLDKGSSVCQTSDGGYILTGYTRSFGTGLSNAYLIKTNVDGDTLWTKTFGYGGSSITTGNSVRQTSDGGYFIGGQVEMLGTDFVYLLKTTDNGTLNSVKLIPTKETEIIAQNYPNPFKSNTTINYYIPVNGFVTLTIYDNFGRIVATLVDGQKQKGTYHTTFNASDLVNGLYEYKIQIGSDFAETKKLSVLK